MSFMTLTPSMAQEALLELLRDLNYTAFPDVKITVLPPDADAPPASINSAGIYLHSRIGTDFKHIKMYLLHELYHAAVYMPDMEKYPFVVVNVAEDLHINWCLLKYHNMDVRTAPFPGVYDEKLGPLSPQRIARKLMKKRSMPTTWTHGTRVYQPQLIDIADHIRTRWLGLEDRHVLARNTENNDAFRKCLTTLGTLHPDLGAVVDPAVVLRGCFQHSFDTDPTYIGTTFDPSAQLVVGMNPPRKGTIQNDLFAEIATDMYIANVSGWNCYAPQLVTMQQYKIDKLNGKLVIEKGRKKPKQKRIDKIVLRIERTKKRLVQLKEMAGISIPHELKNNPLVQYKRGAKSISLLSRVQTDVVPRNVPGVRNSVLKRVLALCSRPLRILGNAAGKFSDMENMLGKLMPKDGSRAEKKRLAMEVHENKMLAKLLQLVPAFDKAFQSRPRKTGEEFNVQTMLGYGQDLTEVEASELALLAKTETEQTFWQRYVDHSLLQRSPIQSREQPVYISIDCSGSMGKAFMQAVSMAISLAKVLLSEGRQCTITIFNESIVAKVDAPESTFQQIYSLLTSHNVGGGTDIMVPIDHAFETRAKRGWKSMYAIIISDGDDVPNMVKGQSIAAKRKPGDRLHLMLVRPSKQKAFGFDTISHGNSMTSMVNLAKSVL